MMISQDYSARYSLVIFDFDGTLANSYQWFVSVYADLADRFQLPPLTKDELEQLRRLDIRLISRRFNIPFWKILQIGSYLQQQMAREIHKVGLVDGMPVVLDRLVTAGIRLAVVSSNAEDNVRQVLGADYAKRFEVFECGVSMFGKKTKFEKVLRKTSIPPSQALSIGDEIRDLKASHQAGIAFGAAGWGSTNLDTFTPLKPEESFLQPEEILDAVFPDRLPGAK